MSRHWLCKGWWIACGKGLLQRFVNSLFALRPLAAAIAIIGMRRIRDAVCVRHAAISRLLERSGACGWWGQTAERAALIGFAERLFVAVTIIIATAATRDK